MKSAVGCLESGACKHTEHIYWPNIKLPCIQKQCQTKVKAKTKNYHRMNGLTLVSYMMNAEDQLKLQKNKAYI